MDNNEQIELSDRLLPPLFPGEYEITVDQQVQGHTLKGTPCTIYVAGPRFTIPDEELGMRFPPPNHSGVFHDALPHIILNRATLPWERSPDEHTPWLALLLFNEHDPGYNDAIKTPQQHPVSDVTGGPSDKDLWKPKLDVSSWETLLSTDAGTSSDNAKPARCTTITVDRSLLTAILPKKDYRHLLAHCRKHAKTESGNMTAMVIGNRFPTRGAHHTAHLVSLEGLPDTLDTLEPSYKKIILISLAHWSFSATTDNETFAGLLSRVNAGPLRLPDTSSEPVQDEKVHRRLTAGYTALPHHRRDGTATASWYRGPCVPQRSDASALPPLPPTGDPFACADAFLIYDTVTTLFDVSYAAAWQLGLFLALRDQDFARNLFNWRRRNQVAVFQDHNLQTMLDRTIPANIRKALPDTLPLTKLFAAEEDRKREVKDHLPLTPLVPANTRVGKMMGLSLLQVGLTEQETLRPSLKALVNTRDVRQAPSFKNLAELQQILRTAPVQDGNKLAELIRQHLEVKKQ